MEPQNAKPCEESAVGSAPVSTVLRASGSGQLQPITRQYLWAGDFSQGRLWNSPENLGTGIAPWNVVAPSTIHCQKNKTTRECYCLCCRPLSLDLNSLILTSIVSSSIGRTIHNASWLLAYLTGWLSSQRRCGATYRCPLRWPTPHWGIDLIQSLPLCSTCHSVVPRSSYTNKTCQRSQCLTGLQMAWALAWTIR